MESDLENAPTRGKNWSYNDIINLLYAAINLNVMNLPTLLFFGNKSKKNIFQITDKLNNKTMSKTKIYKKLAEEIPDKNWNQIQIKYNRLRRAHLNGSSELSMFKEQMDALWGAQKHRGDPSAVGKSDDDDCEYTNDREYFNSDANDEEQSNSNGQQTNESYETKFVDLPEPPKKRKMSARTRQESLVIDPLLAKLEANKSTESISNEDVKSKSVDMFFQSMSETVKSFPLHLIVQAKKSVCSIIGELELQALELSQRPNTRDLKTVKSFIGCLDSSD